MSKVKGLNKLLTSVVAAMSLSVSYQLGRLHEIDDTPEPPPQTPVVVEYHAPDCGHGVYSPFIEYTARAAAMRYGLEQELVLSVMWQESGGNPALTSSKGAMGLMQLMPDTAKDLGVEYPYSIVENIDGGVKYLAWLKKRWGLTGKDLYAAYNWGVGNVLKRTNKMPKETRNYIACVNMHMKKRPWEKK